MRETWVWFLGREDPLEKEMAIHSSTLAWKIPWTEEPDRLESMGSQRVGHDWATSLSLSSTLNGGFSSGSDGKESGCNAGDSGSIPGSGRSPGEGNGYHTSIPAGEFHGQRRRTIVHGVVESPTTERLSTPNTQTTLIHSLSNLCPTYTSSCHTQWGCPGSCEGLPEVLNLQKKWKFS